MPEINFDIPALLLSLLCLVYCLTAKKRQYSFPKTAKGKLHSQHFIFLMMLIANLLCSGSSVAGYYIPYGSFPGIYYLQYIVYVIYFISHSTLSIGFAIYIMNVTGMNRKKSIFFVFSLPYLASIVLILINVFNKWTFYIDDELMYHRGPLMYLLYGLGLFYVLGGFILFLKNKKTISRNDSIAVASFIVIGALGIGTQAIFSQIVIELFFEALACLVLMMVLEEKGGHVDPTTGLLNRASFAELNKRLMTSTQKYVVVLLRLKELQTAIKRYGEKEIDLLLKNVAYFLVRESEVKDVFCTRRASFAVIFRETRYDNGKEFVNKILKRFEEEWIIDSAKIKADVAVTTVSVPDQIKSFEDLDNLVSYDFHKIRPGSFFVPSDKVELITRIGIYEKAIKKAINDKKLVLHYQPIWSVKEKRTVSAEALLRIDCPELINISPQEYIPIAEKTGLIKDIGLFVFEEVCKFLSNQKIADSPIKYVELNLSVYQFVYNDLIDNFEEIRKRYGIDAGKINLEITETMASTEEGGIFEQLEKLRSLGYTLSLDDFGTGYSNLIRMMGSPFQNIKIDKSILWNISKEGGNPELLANISGFVRKQGFDIIQEGVETKEELDIIIKCGFDYAQGYYFSRPVPQDKFIEYLENEK